MHNILSDNYHGKIILWLAIIFVIINSRIFFQFAYEVIYVLINICSPFIKTVNSINSVKLNDLLFCCKYWCVFAVYNCWSVLFDHLFDNSIYVLLKCCVIIYISIYNKSNVLRMYESSKLLFNLSYSEYFSNKIENIDSLISKYSKNNIFANKFNELIFTDRKKDM